MPTFRKLARSTALLLVVVLTACSGTGQPRPAKVDDVVFEPEDSGRLIYMQPVPPLRRTVVSKNYSIGTRRVAAVGEPMVGVRNYTASDTVVNAVALSDFRQDCRRTDGTTERRVRDKVTIAELLDDEVDEVEEGAKQTADEAQRVAERPGSSFAREHAPTAHKPGGYGGRGDERSRSGRRDGRVVHRPSNYGDDADGERGILTRVFGGLFSDSEDGDATGHDDATGEGQGTADPVYGTTTPRKPAVVRNISTTDDGPALLPAADTPVDDLACRTGKLRYVAGTKGARYQVAGSFNEAAKMYYLIRLEGRGGAAYLAVDGNGRIKPGQYVTWRDDDDDRTTPLGLPLKYLDTPVPLGPETALFRYETEETVIPHGSNHLHYELIYKGTTYDHRGMVYHVLYKEYRRDEPSQPIYLQDLAFSGHTSTVDVVGMRIRVHDVNEAQIIYSVQRD